MAAVLCALRVWTVRIVVPPHLPSIGSNGLKTLPGRSGRCRCVRRTIDELALGASSSVGVLPRGRQARPGGRALYRDRSAFQSPRFQLLYRAWRHDGEAVLVQAGRLCSPTLSRLQQDASRVHALGTPLTAISLQLVSVA